MATFRAVTAARVTTGLAIVAWWALAVAALVVTLGPISLPAIGLSISEATRPAVVALVFGGASAALAWRTGTRPDMSAFHYATIAGAGTLTIVALVACGATNVGGADSAGYLAQAQRWRTGQMHSAVPLTVPGLREPVWAQSALGFRPGPEPGVVVPTYPPGLPWLEAVAQTIGGDTAAVRVLPLLAAVAALLGLVLVARPLVGLAGTSVVVVALASSAPFLYQALQPMSDVPALAGWLLALGLAARSTRRSLVAAALAVFIVITVRPNLAPLVVPVCWQALGAPARNWRRASVIAVSAAAAVLVVAVIQFWLYGSPMQSGYGRGSELFALEHVRPNLERYRIWLTEAFAFPGLALAGAGTVALAWASIRRAALRPALLMVAMTVALYLVYIPFDSWTYLRFILIAIALAPLGMARLVTATHDRLPASLRLPLTIALTLIVSLPNLQVAQAAGVFAVRRAESRYRLAGRFVRDALPADTVLLAGQHSASAPYYSERPVLRADLIDADDLDAIERWAKESGRTLAIVLDADEAQRLRSGWHTASLGQLEWIPRAEVGRPVGTYIWVAADREAYLAGAPMQTTRLADR